MITPAPRLVAAAAALLLVNAPGGPVAQELPPEQSMEALFSISGQVVDALDGYFVLRSQGGRTKIRFRGWPSDLPGDRAVLGIGDNVTATGWLGPDTLNVGGILDVVGVYVEDRRAYFALGESVEGDSESFAPILLPSGGFALDDSQASLTGVISGIGDDELTLRAGEARITVDTRSMNYNPLDDIGSQRLSLGDMVMVEGVLERNAEDGHRLSAASVTSIFVIGAAT